MARRKCMLADQRDGKPVRADPVLAADGRELAAGPDVGRPRHRRGTSSASDA